ncbi:hypothetical protein BKA66DRAFT_454504 [Pyrenochaeta sp. MPI-SDFR-AT-0127]|nr:hypothetical protein BKA66DRAFT_454504 [Pyrenochaeta sp. MPI-SDFR-AT-0127]
MPGNTSTNEPSAAQPTERILSASTSSWWPHASPIWQHVSLSKRLLIDYLEPKVHPALKQSNWRTIVVKGSYKRGNNTIISSTENPGRGFNWQRPTAEVADELTVLLHCFPGIDYVRHYASLISTYFSILPDHNEMLPQVRFELPELGASSHLFSHSNIVDIGQADVIIMGYLENCPGHVIECKRDFAEIRILQEEVMFSWTKHKTAQGYNVAYLGCAVPLWGEVVEEFVHLLKRLSQMKCVLYVGRVGSLDSASKPNEVLATGTRCNIGDEVMHWDNALSAAVSSSPNVHHGGLVTVSSPLCEDHVWFQRWKEECRWVDCETAYIARASKECGIAFGYLHIVSDNLGREYADSLANEDTKEILAKRSVLFEEIDRILGRFLKDFV